MALVCCSFFFNFCLRQPELQGLECSLVDRDPGSKLGPSMAHDFELSCDGLQLWPRSVFNFYCELFHRLANMAFGKQIIGLSLF